MESLIKALKGEPTYKEYTLGSIKVYLRTLTRGELDEVIKSTVSNDFLAQSELIKLPILSRSIVKINDVDVRAYADIEKSVGSKTPIHELVMSSLKELDSQVVNSLYDMYVDLIGSVQKEQEELKKSWASPATEPSGSSSES
jgi:hypothetical protein